ncbi:MAG: hypothetical protein WB609_00895 [Candidatus Cybelea sp.]
MTLEEHEAQLFETVQRRALEQLSAQGDTLRLLFDRAREANDALPQFPPVQLDRLNEEERQALSDFFDQDGRARGARDAFATAIVIFFDLMFKELRIFYNRIPERAHVAVGVDGIDLGTIFRHTANNLRHYLDWRVPPSQLTHAEKAVAAAATIAKLMSRDEPTRETVAVWANNWAWPVLAKISGRSFDGLKEIVEEALSEMLSNAWETGRYRSS